MVRTAWAACCVGINEGGTGYSHSDRQNDWKAPGLGYRHVVGSDSIVLSLSIQTGLRQQTGENDSTLTVYFVPEFPSSWRDGNARHPRRLGARLGPGRRPARPSRDQRRFPTARRRSCR